MFLCVDHIVCYPVLIQPKWPKCYFQNATHVLNHVTIYSRTLEESIRWLITRERYDDAEKSVNRIARFNRREKPDISIIVKKAADAIQSQDKDSKTYTLLDLFRTPQYRTITIGLLCVWYVRGTFPETKNEIGIYKYAFYYTTIVFYINICISYRFDVMWEYTIISITLMFSCFTDICLWSCTEMANIMHMHLVLSNIILKQK